MNGRNTSIIASDGGKFSGYLSMPKSAKAPGVVIIQEIFGVNDHIREVVDEYAEAGYVALAPDMFWRIEPNVRLGYTPEEVQKAAHTGRSSTSTSACATSNRPSARCARCPNATARSRWLATASAD